MDNRIIGIDEGYCKHRAIFSYIALHKIEREKLMKSEDVDEDTARRMLEIKLKNNIIFLPQPTLTFMRMIIGYFKKLKVTSADRILFFQDYGSWRKAEDVTYKRQRKEKREEKEDDLWWTNTYNSFNELYNKLEPVINWNFCRKYLMESDDWASVCCKVFSDKEIILISSDVDWEMLCIYGNVKIFSPLQNKKTKVAKYKDVPNPMGVLASKINKDISDNLLHAPTSEREFAIRNKIVNLIELPEEIERPLKEVLLNLPLKNLSISKIPYASVRKELEKLYK